MTNKMSSGATTANYLYIVRIIIGYGISNDFRC